MRGKAAREEKAVVGVWGNFFQTAVTVLEFTLLGSFLCLNSWEKSKLGWLFLPNSCSNQLLGFELVTLIPHVLTVHLIVLKQEIVLTKIHTTQLFCKRRRAKNSSRIIWINRCCDQCQRWFPHCWHPDFYFGPDGTDTGGMCTSLGLQSGGEETVGKARWEGRGERFLVENWKSFPNQQSQILSIIQSHNSARGWGNLCSDKLV